MNVMKRAWEIAKEGQKKFGGKVKEYFRIALKMAWAESKGSTFTEEKLAERIILVANHDTKEYNVYGERNGHVFWKKEGIASTDKSSYLEAYGHLNVALGIKVVSLYTIKSGAKKFIETKEVA